MLRPSHNETRANSRGCLNLCVDKSDDHVLMAFFCCPLQERKSLSFPFLVTATGMADKRLPDYSQVSGGGREAYRRYGLTTRRFSKDFFASSSLISGSTITSSPGSQLTGVMTPYLSLYWSESTTRRISLVLRPVDAGYNCIRRIFFWGSTIKTDRMVIAIPRESTLVVSWWSNLDT